MGPEPSPTEVEAGVMEHPDITAAVAFGHTNIKIGEDIVCAYTSRGGQPLPERLLRQQLKNLLPRHMVPTYLVHFEEFGITGNDGKFDRKAIKEAARNRLGLDNSPAQPQPLAV